MIGDTDILPRPPDDMAQEAGSMDAEPLFQVTNEVTQRWCDQPVILRPDRWDHAVERHPEVASYMEEVRMTLEEPNFVIDTGHQKPTLVFYRRHLLEGNPRYRGCYVAVFVRYKKRPPCVWTAYFPSRIKGGAKVLYAKA